LSRATTKYIQQELYYCPVHKTYAEKYPPILDSQINWIARNAKQIDFVLQQGDLTQNNNDEEWKRVQSAFNKLNNKVPYVLVPGNHDMGSKAGQFANVRRELFKKTFSLISWHRIKDRKQLSKLL
jgi:predicted MPP superfamily phosphohydrolase